jgi:hypothetical protein
MAKFSCTGSTFKIGTAGSGSTAAAVNGALGAPGTPGTTIGQVQSGDADFGELNMIDATTKGNEARVNLPGTRAPMSGTITVAWDKGDTGIAAAMTAWEGKTLVSFGFFYADGASVISDGYITNVTAPDEVDGLLTSTITFMGSGKQDYAAGA